MKYSTELVSPSVADIEAKEIRLLGDLYGSIWYAMSGNTAIVVAYCMESHHPMTENAALTAIKQIVRGYGYGTTEAVLILDRADVYAG